VLMERRKRIIKKSIATVLCFSTILSATVLGMPKAYATPVDTTLSFINDNNSCLGKVIHDGDYQSTPINGFQLDIYCYMTDADANTADTTDATTLAQYFGYFDASEMSGSMMATEAHNGAFFTSTDDHANQDGSQPKVIVIKSHDGSEFKFKSIFAAQGNGGSSYVVNGYKDGAFIPNCSQTLDLTTSGSTFSMDSKFGAVDEVRISTANSSDVNWAYYNDITIETTPVAAAPTTTISSAALSLDTGVSGSDFITNTAAQTISGTLSANLASGENVEVSYDGGSNWSNATSYSVGSSSWSTTTTLSGSNTFKARVTNTNGSSTAYTHTYTLDTTAPTITFSNLVLSADNGTSSTDFITNTAAQTITATLSGTLAAGDVVFGSLNGGTNWTDITSKVSGTTLTWSGATLNSGSNTLKLKVTDTAGNDGAVNSQGYTLDTTVPAITLSNLKFSDDTGTSSTDFITNTTAQTITATLSGTLAAGDVVYGSLNGGTSWTDITTKVSGTTLTWSGATLNSGSNTLKLKVTDAAGNDGAVTSQGYTLDTTAPTVTSIIPSSGLAAGGTSVTISGTNFTGTPTVTIGGVAATSVSLVDSTTITAVTPSGTIGAKNVVVTTASGSATGTDLFTYVVAPIVTTTGGSATYTENGSATPIDSGITVTDADSTTLASATVAITGNRQSSDVLSFVNDTSALYGNIVASYNSGTGVLVLSSSGASATVAQWQAALRAVTYRNDSDNPSTATRTVTVAVSDGTNTSDPVTRSISITAVNDAPTNIAISGLPSAISKSDSHSANESIGTLSATDPDSTSWVFSIRSVTLNGSPADTSLFNVSPASSVASADLRITDVSTTPAGSYAVVIRADDGAGATYDKTFTIIVTNNKPGKTLTAASTNFDVDHDFTITYGADAAFKGHITGVSVEGHALTSSEYTLGDGAITLHPGAGDATNPLRAAGTWEVAVHADGYEDSYVTQDILSGAVASIAVSTQPVPGAASGDAFATQPGITLKDQYGNTCADGVSASAGVTVSGVNGTGTWTLGGTQTVQAVSGVATFTNLTSTILAAGQGEMLFMCGSKQVSSGSFTIPEMCSSITPTSASFDKYTSGTNYQEIAVTMTLNGNTLSAVKNGSATLVSGTDYTVSGSSCTIKKNYLSTLSTGSVQLTLDFSMGADRVLNITVSDTTPSSNGSSGGSSGGSSSAGGTAIPTVVEVNGQKQDAGTASTQTTGGQTVTTVLVDDTKLNKILDNSGSNPTVTLPVSGGSDVVVGELNGQTVKSMEQKDATLEIKTDTVTYTLPASQINIDDVSSLIGAQVELKDIKVSVKIAEPSADTVKIIESTASKNSYQLVVKPVEFEITCTSGSKTVDVSKFNGYVERTVAIPDGVDPSKITTGIVLNADGTFRHVPTAVVTINGKYYAKINSLTNSTYSVIWNPVEFKDVTTHWAKVAVNDMGSRMVVTGTGNGDYDPDRSITRAEFAAVVVRALGLAQGTAQSSFSDVSLNDWFNGYADTASDYGLITGYTTAEYGPNDTITREQAMAILARAMELTGLKVSLTDSEISTLLSGYSDGATVSDYAKKSVAMCIKSGVVSGTSATTLSPKEHVTRAEVAVMVERLLKESGLI
jgi:hypothetical protein